MSFGGELVWWCMGVSVSFGNGTVVAWLRLFGVVVALVVMWLLGLDDALWWLRWWVGAWWLVMPGGFGGGLMASVGVLGDFGDGDAW